MTLYKLPSLNLLQVKLTAFLSVLGVSNLLLTVPWHCFGSVLLSLSSCFSFSVCPRLLSFCLDILVAILWERVVSLAFHLCGVIHVLDNVFGVSLVSWRTHVQGEPLCRLKNHAVVYSCTWLLVGSHLAKPVCTILERGCSSMGSKKRMEVELDCIGSWPLASH